MNIILLSIISILLSYGVSIKLVLTIMNRLKENGYILDIKGVNNISKNLNGENGNLNTAILLVIPIVNIIYVASVVAKLSNPDYFDTFISLLPVRRITEKEREYLDKNKNAFGISNLTNGVRLEVYQTTYENEECYFAVKYIESRYNSVPIVEIPYVSGKLSNLDLNKPEDLEKMKSIILDKDNLVEVGVEYVPEKASDERFIKFVKLMINNKIAQDRLKKAEEEYYKTPSLYECAGIPKSEIKKKVLEIKSEHENKSM